MPSLIKTFSLVVVVAFVILTLYWLTLPPQTPTPANSKNPTAHHQLQAESLTSPSLITPNAVSFSHVSSTPNPTSAYASPITPITTVSASPLSSRLPVQPSSATPAASRSGESAMTTSNPSSVLSPASSPSTSDAGSTQPPAWELPPGVKVPAAFLENGETLSPPAAAANEQIAQSFEAEIDTTSKAATDGATEISDADWTKAQRRADELYRSLFGDAAYNQQGMHTAIEAKASLTETQ